MADKCAQDNYEKIVEEISGMECESGGVHPGKLWKLRKSLCPKSRDPPTAMLDEHGNLVTSPSVIENLALDTYKKRLDNRPMKDSLEHIRTEKEELCKKRIDIVSNIKSEPWTLEELEKILNSLQTKKCRDPQGYINELFNP